MNEPDSYALEEALRLKEKHGGEVIALSMGPERVKQTIKEALAKGADRGIHITDDNFAQLDPLGSAKALAAADQKRKGRPCSHRPPERRPRLRSDRRAPGRALGSSARHHHHADRSPGQKNAPQARTRSRLVPADGVPVTRGAFHPVRHQQSPLRHSKRHHGRQEKRNRHRSPANLSPFSTSPRKKSKKSTCPRKPKRQNSSPALRKKSQRSSSKSLSSKRG